MGKARTCGTILAIAILAAAGSVSAKSSDNDVLRPNIVLMLMDNLTYGEPGVYAGGSLRVRASPC